MAYMRLGDLLVASGVITPEQIEEALKIQKETHQRLGDVLIQNSFITERNLIDALQIQLGVEFVDLTAVSIPVELAKYVPRNLARKFCVVPVKLVQDTLYLAMSDPLDFVAQEQVKAASRRKVIPMIATRQATEQAIARLYGNEGTARVIEEMKREAGTFVLDIVPAQMVQDASDSAPTIRFVNSLIERAFQERASDIHLEPQETEMVVRMRVDGLLHRMFTVPTELQGTVISRLKIMGGMNIAEHRLVMTCACSCSRAANFASSLACSASSLIRSASSLTRVASICAFSCCKRSYSAREMVTISTVLLVCISLFSM